MAPLVRLPDSVHEAADMDPATARVLFKAVLPETERLPDAVTVELEVPRLTLITGVIHR